jgi:uncharacterized membrane protein
MSRVRLEAFADGVIAILITILALEIHLPDTRHTWVTVWHMAPVFAAYVLSFLVIAGFWISHHTLMLQTKTVTVGVLWANIHFLFWLSFTRAVTAWFGTDIHAVPAAVLFQLNVMAVNLSFLWLRTVVRKSNPQLVNLAIKMELMSFAINLVTLFAVIIAPPLLFVGLGINSLVWLIPTTKNMRLVTAPRDGTHE